MIQHLDEKHEYRLLFVSFDRSVNEMKAQELDKLVKIVIVNSIAR